MTTYEHPKFATYTPIPGRLTYPVWVHATRSMYGRVEYQISSRHDADSRIWITLGKDGARLQFEEEDLTTHGRKE